MSQRNQALTHASARTVNSDSNFIHTNSSARTLRVLSASVVLQRRLTIKPNGFDNLIETVGDCYGTIGKRRPRDASPP